MHHNHHIHTQKIRGRFFKAAGEWGMLFFKQRKKGKETPQLLLFIAALQKVMYKGYFSPE